MVVAANDAKPPTDTRTYTRTHARTPTDPTCYFPGTGTPRLKLHSQTTSDVTGIDATSCDTSTAPLTQLQCTLTCAKNYHGNASASCTTSGLDFAITNNCEPGTKPKEKKIQKNSRSENKSLETPRWQTSLHNSALPAVMV